jgi:hypothetical protein
MKYVSVRVQAEYEKFKQGERNQYAVLFINGMIPDSMNFHQQFDLFMKVRPKMHIFRHSERSSAFMHFKRTDDGFVVSDFVGDKFDSEIHIQLATKRYSKLDNYRFGRIYSFPSRRDVVKGCNDICRHCGEWCNDPDAAIWKEYVCLIGMYNGKIPEREHPLQVDPINNSVSTYPYPFVCLKCYEQIYKENTDEHGGYARFMWKEYEIDHVFFMNVEAYPHMKTPVKPRRKTWNKTTVQKIEPSVLDLLRKDGFFHIIISEKDNNPFYCWICGTLESADVRGNFVSGRAIRKLPVKSTSDNVIPYPSETGEYILICDDCEEEADQTDPPVFYPFGIKFIEDSRCRIND